MVAIKYNVKHFFYISEVNYFCKYSTRHLKLKISYDIWPYSVFTPVNCYLFFSENNKKFKCSSLVKN